jgi:Lon-like ATP-dependent protease
VFEGKKLIDFFFRLLVLFQVYRQVAAEVVRSSNELEASSSSTSETAVELDPSLPTSEAPVQGAVPEPAVSSTSPESSSSSSSSSPASSSSSDTTSPSNPSSSSSTTPIVAAPGTTTTLHIKPFSVPSSVSIKVTSENLKDYIGQPSFAKDRIYARAPPPGVCNGLGYNGMGGSLLPIEVTVRLPLSLSLSLFLLSHLPSGLQLGLNEWL